jgi:hypothetical protein
MNATSSLADIVVDRATQLVSAPDTLARMGVASQFRVSCEGWLKLELLRDFALCFLNDDDTDVRPERDLPLDPTGRRRVADLALRRGSEEVFVQLKTFPTNYGAAGKPITNFIDSVVTDLELLCARRGNAVGLVLWLAYPIPDPMPVAWPTHLAKVEIVASATRRAERFELHNGFAHFYAMECR